MDTDSTFLEHTPFGLKYRCDECGCLTDMIFMMIDNLPFYENVRKVCDDCYRKTDVETL